MTNYAGRKWEVRVVEFLRPVFPDMDRDRRRGRFDKGEFIGTEDWTLECKNTKEIRLSEALDQAEREARIGKTRWFAAVINRKNHTAEKAYAVMPLGKLRELMLYIKSLEDGHG